MSKCTTAENRVLWTPQDRKATRHMRPHILNVGEYTDGISELSQRVHLRRADLEERETEEAPGCGGQGHVDENHHSNQNVLGEHDHLHPS